MKKFILLFVLSFFLFSCGDDASIPELPRGKATCKIDGVAKEFIVANSFNNGVLALGNSPNELVSLFFPTPTTFPVTFNMNTEDLITASYVLNGKMYHSTNGVSGIGAKGSFTITVTKYSDSKISGTFELTAIGDDNTEVVITDGVFTNIPDL